MASEAIRQSARRRTPTAPEQHRFRYLGHDPAKRRYFVMVDNVGIYLHPTAP